MVLLAKSAYRFPPGVAAVLTAEAVAAAEAAARFFRASSSFWICAKVFFVLVAGVATTVLPAAGLDQGELAGTAGETLLAQFAEEGNPGAGGTG